MSSPNSVGKDSFSTVLPEATLSLLLRIPLQPAEYACPKSKVCVTGATGYIAGPIIERLLRAGHTVHATCRDLSKMEALAPLLALPGAGERLRLFKADLEQPGSFDAAIAGCEYVMHVAAPVLLAELRAGEGKSKIVEPMVRGVENVLDTVNRTPSVRRVVLTSSISAVCTESYEPEPKPIYTEADWTSDALVSDTFLPYWRGKTLSERRAWELAGAQSRWDLVAVLPSIVMGPTVAGCTGSESVKAMREMFWPGMMWPAVGNMSGNFVDTRDVALAHCLAMAVPRAKGRYIVSAHDTSMYDCTHVMASRFPGFKPALFLLPFWLVWLVAPLVGLHRDIVRTMWGKPVKFDTSRTVADLSLPAWVPLGDTMEDMVRDLAAKGLIKMR